MEVYYSGRWGTVCSNGLSDKYASLICAQLGFGPSGKLTYFGYRGNILLENVMCATDDKILASCGHFGVGIIVKCRQSSAVGVKCHGMLVISMYKEFIFTLRGYNSYTDCAKSSNI